MNRKSVMRKRRKNIMRLATITSEKLLKKDEETGELYPKKEWGYCIEIECNGWKCSVLDDNRFEAMKWALENTIWCSKNQREKYIKEE